MTDLLEFLLDIVPSVSRRSKDLDGYLNGGAMSQTARACPSLQGRHTGIGWLGFVGSVHSPL